VKAARTIAKKKTRRDGESAREQTAGRRSSEIEVGSAGIRIARGSHLNL
jgi:hypothetical protein